MTPPTTRHSRWEPADLVQHQIVSAVAVRQKNSPRVVFKGGTLLRLCYRHDYRFSEDLDFDWVYEDNTKQAMQEFLDGVLKRASKEYGTRFDTKWGAHKLNIYWELPNAQTGVIYTDVKSRDFPGAQPTNAQWIILDRYEEINTADPILGYSPQSMLAAKLDCIADHNRLAARDYYDLLILLQDRSIDVAAALDEFTARYTAKHTHTGAGQAWFDIIFENAYQNEAELADRWNEITQTGMIQEPHQEFAAMFNTIADIAQHALDNYAASTQNAIPNR